MGDDRAGSYAPPEKNGMRGPRLAAILAGALIVWTGIYLLLGPISDFITFDLLHLSPESNAGRSLGVFVYQAPKILLILSLVIFAVGIIRSFFAPERVRRLLAGRSEFAGTVLASMLGIVTPFCTCSAIPLFIGFVEAGVPLGVTFSFLVAAPMINEIVIAMLLNMFDPKVAALYVGTGLVISISAGLVISKLKMERYVEEWVSDVRISQSGAPDPAMTWEDRVYYGYDAVKDTLRRIWIYVLAGMGVGALIHGYVPEGYITSIMGQSHWWSVPAAVLVGVPIYSSAAGVIPIVQALMEKGAATGTVLAFMMSVIGLSLPEIIILRKALKWRLIAVFAGVVAAGIVIVGYLLNAIL